MSMISLFMMLTAAEAFIPPPPPPPLVLVHYPSAIKSELTWRLYCARDVWVSVSILNEGLTDGSWVVRITDLRAKGLKITPAQRADADAKFATLSQAVSASARCGGSTAVVRIEGYAKPNAPGQATRREVDLIFGSPPK